MEEDSISFIHVNISCWGLPDCFTSKSSFSFSFCTHFFEGKKKSIFVLAYPEYNFCPPSWLTLIRRKKKWFVYIIRIVLQLYLIRPALLRKEARRWFCPIHTRCLLHIQDISLTASDSLGDKAALYAETWGHMISCMTGENVYSEERGGKSDPLHAFYAKEKINKNAWGFFFFFFFIIPFSMAPVAFSCNSWDTT